MSLIKSFNYNLFKQNLKKSKGMIIISLIIVPLIISIYLVLSGIWRNSQEIVLPQEFGIADLIFMYIIPFIYSASLFGFVFKKPSTDFMNSMPINRKTMFVTNTITGIILITIIQLLSGFFILLWGAVFKNLIIFPMAVLEMIILSWVSYVFVFVVSNLAMSISGTQLTQFIVTILILFLVPTSTEMMKTVRNAKHNEYRYSYMDYSGYSDRNNYDVAIVNGHQTTYYYEVNENENYTMPFRLFYTGSSFSSEVILKMAVISIVYYFVGLKLYLIKKMEYSEETFSNTKLHIFVKALTLIPIFLILNMINAYEDSLSIVVTAIILSAIYYFVFDLIVKRKVPLKTSIISFIVTIFVIQASISFIGGISYKQKDIDFDDVKAISIGRSSNSKESYYYRINSFYNNNYVFDGDYYINDKDILETILDGRAEVEDDREVLYSDDGYIGKDIYFNIETKSGKNYHLQTTIPYSYYNRVINSLKNNEEYIGHVKDMICNSSGIITIGNDIVDNKTKRKIEKQIKEDIDAMDLISTQTENVYNLSKTVYRNHRMITYYIPLNNNVELFKTVAEFENEETIKNIKGYRYGININVYDKYNSLNKYYSDEDILDFIEENVYEEFDPTENYYILSGSLNTLDGYKSFIFYTNKTKQLDKMLEKAKYSY